MRLASPLALAVLAATTALVGHGCSCGAPAEATCTPACNGKACGDDGCNGSCGDCSARAPACADAKTLRTFSATCRAGQCVVAHVDRSCAACSGGACGPCVPSCAGRACGDDGCGGTCGTCAATKPPDCESGTVARTYGAPSCSAGACVYPVAQRSCASCVDGACTGCVPDCLVHRCGDDGCGGSCGACDTGPYKACVDAKTLRSYTTPGTCDADGSCNFAVLDLACGGRCTPDFVAACADCTPACASGACGSDGCGGQCPSCGAQTCGGSGMGQCGTTTPAFPGVTPVLVAAHTPSAVVVSPDERHVALLRGPPDASPGQCNNLDLNLARATLEVATLPDAGATSVVAVTSSVAMSSGLGPKFSGDGKRLAFADGATSPCQDAAELELASADGTGISRVAIDVRWFAFAGSTLVWLARLPGNRAESLWARALPSGAPLVLATDADGDYALPDPTGAAVAYKRADGTYALAQTAGGTPTTLAPANSVRIDYGTWSHSGDYLAFVQYPKLTVAARDGSAVVDVAQSFDGAYAFSPDDARLAYSVASGGGADAVVVTLATNARVTLSGISMAAGGFAGSGTLSWSAGGAWLFALARPGPGQALSAARTSASGPFTLLASDNDWYISFAASPAEDYVAVTLAGPSTVLLVPLAGGAATTLFAMGGDAVFEATRAAPKLAVFDTIYASGALELYAADGTGRVVAPGVVYNRAPDGAPGQKRWYGRTLVYAASPRVDPQFDGATTFDVHGITDDGAKSGALGREVRWWRTAALDAPRRVFFATGPAAGDALYAVTLP